MKFIPIIILFCIVSSCEKSDSPKPEACISISDASNLHINQTINVLSCSENAKYIMWDFGDETISYEQKTSHSYKEPGTYLLSLVVQNVDFTDLNGDGRIDKDDISRYNSSIISIEIVVLPGI
ncbi:PKD domain-containing protein [Carboxylicivirga sediminis]|uniref:PKD domain-containing protein n=1 Tax=Carboxylicivirga sediminis TaxID=2006564 RepID=A0A941J066_9BACT|nr:PKD domain-containing protein [Carboxylicivirga sediminis]MBR8537839.1 PKD domain-containing protein [Carboxylicivirga sediminis]